MSTFTESDLTFTFPPAWVVRQFDRTAAYRSVSGHGLKGVDFLALGPDDELWLIEVKNFRRRDARTSMLRRTPVKLAEQIARKFTDTRRLIDIMAVAMDRRRWMSIRLRWDRLRNRGPEASHYLFWREVSRRSALPRIRCLLWLETPESATDYAEAVRELLAPRIPPGSKLIIAETESTEPLPVSVTINPVVP